MSVKAMSLRLHEEQASELEAIARVEGVTVTDLVREAIRIQIAAKRADQDFQARLKKRIKQDKEALKRLAT